MKERYIVSPKDIINVESNGVIVGFTMKVKSPYYRNIFLDNIAMMRVRVDNMLFTEDDITFSIAGGTFTLDEMETMDTFLWDADEKAIVFVPLEGGIERGTHIVEIGIGIRINKKGNVQTTSNTCYLTSQAFNAWLVYWIKTLCKQ